MILNAANCNIERPDPDTVPGEMARPELTLPPLNYIYYLN